MARLQKPLAVSLSYFALWEGLTMQFSIIYSVDVPDSDSIRPFVPSQRHLFTQTEGDSQYDYSYLEGEWAKGKHRKFCAVLNRKQFERFLSDTGLFAERVKTMGSLGAPGLGYGLSPAVSFRTDDQRAILNAYVTPIPEVPRANGFTERDWERIEQAMWSVYA